MRLAILCLLLSAVAISADLQSDIDDIVSDLPMEKLISLVQAYIANNPNIRVNLIYMHSLVNDGSVNAFLKTDPMQALIGYFNDRGVDGERIILHLIKLAKGFSRAVLEPQSGHSGSSVLENTEDFGANFRGVLVESGILTKISEKIESSPEFEQFVNAVLDPKFKTLVYRAAYSNRCVDCEFVARGFWSNLWNNIKEATKEFMQKLLTGILASF